MGFLQEVKRAVLETNAVWGLQVSLKLINTSRHMFREVSKTIGKEPEFLTCLGNKRQKAVNEFDERIKRANKK